MGRRSNYETVARILVAFLLRRTWSQADLARYAQIGTRSVRARLLELQEAGLELEQEEDHPHVYWSVPKKWFPGGYVLEAADRALLARLVSRLPNGRDRQHALEVLLAGAANVPAGAPPHDARESDVLSRIEDACANRVPLCMRYYSASRGDRGSRHVSLHRVTYGHQPRFVATCHRTDALRWFRVSRVESARLDEREAFRPIADAELERFLCESIDGYSDGPGVDSSFVVRAPEARWVVDNLPVSMNAVVHHLPSGIRVSARTAGVPVLARFVVGLGDCARAETPELAAEVVRIAKGSLGAHVDGPVRAKLNTQTVSTIRSTQYGQRAR